MPDTAGSAALKFAKAYTPLGPDNQGAGQASAPKPWTPVASPETKLFSKLAIDLLKKSTPPPGCSMADVIGYANLVMKAKAGNCFEQSALVCLFLSVYPGNIIFRLVRLK